MYVGAITTRRKRLGRLGDANVMPYSQAAASAQQILTPPWYYFLFPPAAEIYEISQASKFYTPGEKGSTLLNAATGRPTDAQIAANTNQCVAAIQQMRQVNPGSIPAGAENQCAIDQQAYTKLIGGTAEDILRNLIPPPSPTQSTWALVILAAVIGGVYLVTR